MTNEEFLTAVEQYIDCNGMGYFMDEVSEICTQKADHIRASYGEGDTIAELWDARANLVNKFAANF
jgi:hypothetical protein